MPRRNNSKYIERHIITEEGKNMVDLKPIELKIGADAEIMNAANEIIAYLKENGEKLDKILSILEKQ